jgi:hypothetical protein
MCGVSAAFGQLKVTNNSGQDLVVTVNGQKAQMPYKTAKTFQARGRNVWLEAIANGKKFSIEKSVPRSGSISIESSDIAATSNQQAASSTVGSSGSTESNAVPIEASNASPVSANSANPLRSSKATSAKTNSVVPTPVPSNATSVPTPVTAQSTNNQPVIKEKTIIVYKGSDRFKIFSEIGRGLEFCGADSLNKDDNAKNVYGMTIPKNKDLVIGIGIKESGDPSIWPYAEIRKRVNLWDQECIITSKDVKKMSTEKKKSVRIRLLVPGVKIYFEPGTEVADNSKDKGPISIGYKETSRFIEVPIGLFFIRLTYTDATGMFRHTIFLPIHITDNDRYLEITENNLKGAINESDISNPPAW